MSFKEHIASLTGKVDPVQATSGTVKSRVQELAGPASAQAGNVATAAARPAAYTHYDDGVCPQCGPNGKMQRVYMNEDEEIFFCPMHYISLPIPSEGV